MNISRKTHGRPGTLRTATLAFSVLHCRKTPLLQYFSVISPGTICALDAEQIVSFRFTHQLLCFGRLKTLPDDMDIFVRRASPAERYSLPPLALVADTYGPVNAQKPAFSFCWRRNIMASAAVTSRSDGDCGRILSAVYILFIRGLSPCDILKSLKNMRQERSPHANQNSSCPRAPFA